MKGCNDRIENSFSTICVKNGYLKEAYSVAYKPKTEAHNLKMKRAFFSFFFGEGYYTKHMVPMKGAFAVLRVVFHQFGDISYPLLRYFRITNRFRSVANVFQI